MASGPLLVVITGPSGAGKDSVLQRLKSLGRDYFFAITATTRLPRPGEVDGKDYYFVSPERFEEMAERGVLLEHATVYGYRYGVPEKPVREAMESGRHVLLRTDVQGARYIKSRMPSAITVFLTPPSEGEFERRLRERGEDTEEQIRLRLEVAEAEMASAEEFDYRVVNDDLDRCAREIEEIIGRESRSQ